MSREAMQLALSTLEGWANYDDWVWPESALEQAKRNTIEAITALRQALETEQESVRLQCTTCETVYADGVPPQVAQQEPEPVAWFSTSPDGKLSNKFACKPTEGNWVEPLYTAPLKREITCVCGAVWEGETMVHSPREREWVGLTDEEVAQAMYRADAIITGPMQFRFAKEIEAKLKEKNHG